MCICKQADFKQVISGKLWRDHVLNLKPVLNNEWKLKLSFNVS